MTARELLDIAFWIMLGALVGVSVLAAYYHFQVLLLRDELQDKRAERPGGCACKGTGGCSR